MNNIAKAIDHPATLAMSYLNIGTELERAGHQEKAIEYLEMACDESFRASKQVMAVTNAYLARAYASARLATKFKRSIETAIRIAKDVGMYYGDGTDFVFHWFQLLQKDGGKKHPTRRTDLRRGVGGFR